MSHCENIRCCGKQTKGAISRDIFETLSLKIPMSPEKLLYRLLLSTWTLRDKNETNFFAVCQTQKIIFDPK